MLIQYVTYNVKPHASYRLTTRRGIEASLQNQAPPPGGVLYEFMAVPPRNQAQYSQQKFVCKYSSKTTKIHFFYENNSHWAENLLANPMIALQ